MKILVTGKRGNSGSWRIRGHQLGNAIGATVLPMASAGGCRAADLVVVVKKTPVDLIRTVQQSGRPWVFDTVDGWPQQPCSWQGPEAIEWLQGLLGKLKPTGVVFGTEQMQEDACFAGPSIVLPHHSWHRYIDGKKKPIRDISIVGYEGNLKWIGRWASIVRSECERRGWQFEINGDMTRADIGIALRDGGGYPAQYWKPGTKLSNLHALGIPAICSVEAGYRSVSCGHECWVNTEDELRQAFDSLLGIEHRAEIRKHFLAATIRLETVAADYLAWLKTLV